MNNMQRKPAWPSRPRGLTERGYRKYMAKQGQDTINGTTYVFQSCSPEAYYDNYDRFGRGKNTKRYIDWLIRNIVVSPPEVANTGIEYFNKRDDVATPTMLMESIENFLAVPAGKQGPVEGQSAPKA